MVYQTNPELRVLDVIQARTTNSSRWRSPAASRRSPSSPASGTNMGGWGTLMKTGPGKLDDVLIRFPGVLKIAQAGNPERAGRRSRLAAAWA